jgi:hypothetical protein
MSYAKPKIKFTGLDATHPNNNTIIIFDSWQQRPQQEVQQVEYTTRLGSSQLVISKIKKESPPSQVTAIIGAGAGSNSDSVELAIKNLETTIKPLRDNLGKKFEFTDEHGIVLDRCYIMSLSYNIKACTGTYSAICTLNMLVMTDIAPTTAGTN